MTNEEVIAAFNRLIEQAAQNSGSSAAEEIVSTIPIVGIIFGFVLLFFFLLWQYRLKKAIITSGQYTPTRLNTLKILSLLMGVTCTVLGFPLSILFYSLQGLSYSLLGGIIPLFFGVSMLIFYMIFRNQIESSKS